ncbi:MAG: T9SS type A sorting domain-containing protein [Crocinitomicaceae bacterium]|nr:T9SS type A sorting domain-containing protein [Crocinitomicaceae bacterium]
MKKNYLLFSIFLIASFGVFGQAPCSVSAIYIDSISCGNTSADILVTGTVNTGACNSGNVFFDDFDYSGNNPITSACAGPLWDCGVGNPLIITNNTCGVPSLDNSNFLWMGDSSNNGNRSMVTNGLDLTGLNNIKVCFEMRYGIQGQTSPCEGPDLANEGVTLQYSIDNGTTWVNLDYWAPTNSGMPGGTPLDMTVWNQFNVTLPPAAFSANTKFRWIQLNLSNWQFDNWGLDNVSIGDSSIVDYTISIQNTGQSLTQGVYSGTLYGVTPVNSSYQNTYVVEMSNGINSCYDTVSAFLGSNYQIAIDSLFPANCPSGGGQVYLSIPLAIGNGGIPGNSWVLQQNNVTIDTASTNWSINQPHYYNNLNLSSGTYTMAIYGQSGGQPNGCSDTVSFTINSTGCSINADYSPNNYSCFDSITLSAVGTACNVGSSTGCYNGAYFSDDFNSGWPVGWHFVQASTVSANICGVNSIDNTNFLWMSNQSTSPRVLETNDLDLSNGGGICFEMRYAIQGHSAPCEGPDLPTEGVYLQYSTDSGATWNQVNYWPPTNFGSPGGTPLDMTVWNQFTEQLPLAAQTSSTRIRWIQSTSSSANYDNWGIDNVNIGDAISASGNYTLTWLHDNYSLATGVSSGSNPTPIIAPNSTAGAVSYVVQMSNGNYSCYDTVVINTPGAIINLDSLSNVLCGNDGSVMVSNVGGASTNSLNFVLSGIGVLVDTNITNGVSCTFNGLSSGVYDVVLTDTNSCADTVTFTILQDSLLSASLSMIPDVGAASGSATAQANGGTAPYTYLWNDVNAQTTATASGLVSDWYMVIITDANGCTYSDSIFVTRSINTGLDESSNQNVYIYPNPTNNLIHVSGLDDFSFDIMDLKGRVLSKGRNGNKISVESFADGIYVLKLENNGAIKNFFVVKE